MEDGDSSENDSYQDVSDLAEVTISLIPNKSKLKYEKQYDIFKSWCLSENHPNVTENVLIAYFSEKCKTVKPPTLWSLYSMLKATLKVKDNIEICQFKGVPKFLKRQNQGYESKTSKTFSESEIQTFLLEANDNVHLLRKVVLIFGIAGACGRDELTKLKVKDVEEKDSILIVNLSNTKNCKSRVFTIADDKQHGIENVAIYKKYINLRPENASTDRLFIRFNKGFCTDQNIGLNAIAKVPKEIAEYLKLPEPALYTGHCFRRTSAVLLATASGSMSQLKHFKERRSRSPLFAEVYIKEEPSNNSGSIIESDQINLSSTDPRCNVKDNISNKIENVAKRNVGHSKFFIESKKSDEFNIVIPSTSDLIIQRNENCTFNITIINNKHD